MHSILTIFLKELSLFFSSLIAYIVMGVFVVAIGLIVWVFPDTNVLDYGYADLGVFFNLAPYVLLFLVPAITMRSIAEESKNGTLELLLTKPVSDKSLVAGKFLANWFLVGLTLTLTFIFVYSVYALGNPVGNVDLAAVTGSYTGLFLLAAVLVAMGLWASSLNDNQIVAFVIGVFLGFVFYVGFSSVSMLLGSSIVASFFSWIALDEQYRALGKGLLDTRNVIFMLSLAVFFLGLTYLRIGQLRK